jgi:hypothetical protein
MNFNRKYPSYSCLLPSKNKEVNFRPFLISDEKTLLIIKEEKNTKIIFKSILNLIKDCFFDIDIDQLTIQDMEYLFCNLRAKSVGEQVKVNFVCPTTKEKTNGIVNLEKLKIVPGQKEKILNLDETTKIIFKEPKVSKIISLSGEFDTKHFLKASITKVYMEDNVIDSDEISDKDIDEILSKLTLKEYENVKLFIDNLPKVTSLINYYTKDGVEKKLKLEGILNFFTHA